MVLMTTVRENGKRRVRILEGQDTARTHYNLSWNIQCSRSVRHAHQLGSIFEGTVTDTGRGFYSCRDLRYISPPINRLGGQRRLDMLNRLHQEGVRRQDPLLEENLREDEINIFEEF